MQDQQNQDLFKFLGGEIIFVFPFPLRLIISTFIVTQDQRPNMQINEFHFKGWNKKSKAQK